MADKLIRDTCDALNMSATVAALLFASCFQSVIGRPSFMIASEQTEEWFGALWSEVLLWVAFSSMTLISVLCLIIIAFAFVSRMELQNVLPSTQARLFFMLEVNPMNTVTAMSMISMLLFLVLIISGGLLSSPTRGMITLLAVPLFGLVGWPLWAGMRNGPVRLRLEARSFLGIENSGSDLVSYRRRKPGAKSCRLKHYLASHTSCQTQGPPPKMLELIQRAVQNAAPAPADEPEAGTLLLQPAPSRIKEAAIEEAVEKDGADVEVTAIS